MISRNVDFTKVICIHNSGELSTFMVIEVGGRLSTSVEVVDHVSSGEISIAVLLKVVELSKVEKHV